MGVEGLGEGDEGAGLGETEESGVEVAEADAVESVGVFEDGGGGPMGMVVGEFVAAVVFDHCGDDFPVVLSDAAAGEQGFYVGKRFHFFQRVAAVIGAASVVPAADVVDVCGGPRGGGKFGQSERFDKREGVDDDAGGVRLSMQPAGMGEEVWRRGHFFERQRDGIDQSVRHGHRISSRSACGHFFRDVNKAVQGLTEEGP